MSAIDRIASRLGRNDEAPNFELARHLAAGNDSASVAEMAAHLWDRDTAVRSDCIKVLYETGELNPNLIAPYASDFLRLLTDKHNRMVWGGMIAISTIAGIAADALYPHLDEILSAMARGSVITVDNAVRALGRIAASSPERNDVIFPALLCHLETCRPKEIPQHAEHTLTAVSADNRDAFVAMLERRAPELTPSQLARVRKVLKAAKAID